MITLEPPERRCGASGERNVSAAMQIAVLFVRADSNYKQLPE